MREIKKKMGIIQKAKQKIADENLLLIICELVTVFIF